MTEVWTYLGLSWTNIPLFLCSEWIEPFLPLLGLPNNFLEQKELWKEIYTEALNKYETGIEEIWKEIREQPELLSGRERELRIGFLRQQLLSESLNKLVNLVEKEIAVDFEKWLHFYLFDLEFKRAMYYWAEALSCAYMTEKSPNFRKKVPCPAQLIPLLPELKDLVELGSGFQITRKIKQVAPRVPLQVEDTLYEMYGNIPVSEDGMKPCHEATIISQITQKASTFKALEIIAQKLNQTECQEVVKWAEMQLNAMKYKPVESEPKQVCGNKYLRVGLPELEGTSVINS